MNLDAKDLMDFMDAKKGGTQLGILRRVTKTLILEKKFYTLDDIISLVKKDKNPSKWNIINTARGVGRSVDIPKQYPRKFPITVVHYDAIPDNADADLSQAILTDRDSLPLDEVVIRKMDFERFINSLTRRRSGTSEQDDR